ncbi:hypothetical protein E1294_18130 [Nonomuraea diastatica]|uniref:Uncharacterized protein n=1 Tax=Nonomuraea diastatica TaxID=1848329 RepID=A0A4R4WMP2_9ACTN|nr:hypothetical protein E1294_18130 [Nonomuraea diastatica]
MRGLQVFDRGPAGRGVTGACGIGLLATGPRAAEELPRGRRAAGERLVGVRMVGPSLTGGVDAGVVGEPVVGRGVVALRLPGLRTRSVFGLRQVGWRALENGNGGARPGRRPFAGRGSGRWGAERGAAGRDAGSGVGWGAGSGVGWGAG